MEPARKRPPAKPPRPRSDGAASELEVARYIDLKLAALGYPQSRQSHSEFLEIARPLLRNYHQKDLMLGNPLCPADQRIRRFLDDYLNDVCPRAAAQIPGNTFLLDRPGLARVMSLPLGADTFTSTYLHSYRVCLREFCTIRRVTGGPRKDFSTSWRVACRFRRISRPCRRKLLPPCWLWHSALRQSS